MAQDNINERSVCAFCCSVLGTYGFYSEEELAALALDQVRDDDVARLKLAFENDPRPVADVFEEWLHAVRSRAERHTHGMVFTPQAFVERMFEPFVDAGFARIVDCGCGAGRFALYAHHLYARGSTSHPLILAYDSDPLACLLTATAAHLSGARIQVVRGDYLDADLPRIDGKTLFVGNPPYVRHHDLSARQKHIGKQLAQSLGLEGWSKLAGLHAIFLLKCISLAAPGDVAQMLTGAEWLDVNYGQSLRRAFVTSVGGGSFLEYYAPDSMPFHEVMSTALVSTWRPWSAPPAAVKVAYSDTRMKVTYHMVDLQDLQGRNKWSPVCCNTKQVHRDGWILLGDLFSVSRGIVTGCNKFFVLSRDEAETRGLAKYCVPVVARAFDVVQSNGAIDVCNLNKCLLVAPDEVRDSDNELMAYLDAGRNKGVDAGHIVSHRNPWWHITYRPAPVLATYMGRSRPHFALNDTGTPSLNTVHGLYPRLHMSDSDLKACVKYLNEGELAGDAGRVYQGGLKKFEPREMERIEIPPLEAIREWSAHAA